MVGRRVSRSVAAVALVVVGLSACAPGAGSDVAATPDAVWLEVPEAETWQLDALPTQWPVLEDYEPVGSNYARPETPVADGVDYVEFVVWLGDGDATALAEMYSAEPVDELPELLPYWEAPIPPDAVSSDELVDAFAEGWEASIEVFVSPETGTVFILTEED